MSFGISAGTAMLIGGGAALGGAILTSNAAGRAASKQASSTDRATDEQARQYDQTRDDYAPYRDAGKKALGQYETEINAPVTSADVMSDPGYQFGLSQGQLGLDRKAAAAGGRVSGAALKSAAEYANNYATTGYNAAYQRRQDRLNRLASLANIGQTATGGSAAAGAAKSNAISSLISSQGDASAAASMAQGNIWGNAVNQIGAGIGRWASTPYNPGGAFNVSSSGGYTYQDPSSVGPMQSFE